MPPKKPVQKAKAVKTKVYRTVRLSEEAGELAERAARRSGVSISHFVSEMIIENTLEAAIRDSEDFLCRARKTKGLVKRDSTEEGK